MQRVAALLQKARALLFSLGLSLLLLPCARADDTLISLTPDRWLVSFNPRTGAITQFHLKLPPNYLVTGAVWDDIDRKIYLTVEAELFQPPPGYRSGNAIYAVDPAGLAFTKVTEIPDLAGSIAGVTLEPRSHNLLVALRAPGGGDLYLVDRHTGGVMVEGTLGGDFSTEITGLSFDSNNRFLYTLSFRRVGGPVQMTLARFDLTGAEPPKGIPLTLPPAPQNATLMGLVPAPGGNSFYTATRFPDTQGVQSDPATSTFGRLDSESGRVTNLGSAYWGGFSVAPLLYRSFEIDPEHALPAGAPRYGILDVCFPDSCAASVLNDKGDVAGSLLNGVLTPFLIPAGKPRSLLSIPPSASMSHMNSRGVIVGAYAIPYPSPPAPPGHYFDAAFAYAPDTSAFLELYGPRAFYINDRGDISGYVAPDANGALSVLGYSPIAFVHGITNDGVLLASYLAGGNYGTQQILIAQPGLPPIYLAQGLQLTAFNSSGQVVGKGYPADPAFLFKPDVGTVPVPPGEALAVGVGINDGGTVLFKSGGPSALVWDSTGLDAVTGSQLVPLRLLVPADSGWTNLTAVALNNTGQVLVQGVEIATGRNTALLLTPAGKPKPGAWASSVRTEEVGRSAPISSCDFASVNGTKLPCRVGGFSDRDPLR
jgi:hypothetical protein